MVFTVATGGAFFCASSISQRLWGHSRPAAHQRYQALQTKLRPSPSNNPTQSATSPKTDKDPKQGPSDESMTTPQPAGEESLEKETLVKRHHNKKNVAYGVVCGLVANTFFRTPKSRTPLPQMAAISGAYALGSLAAYYLAMGVADQRELADVWRQWVADLPVLGLTKWAIDLYKGLLTEATLAPSMEVQPRQTFLQDTFKYKKQGKKGVGTSQSQVAVREVAMRLRNWPRWVMGGHYVLMFCYLVWLISVYEERVYIPRLKIYRN